MIAENGPIPFTEFMRLALYDPDDGYYAARADQVGRRGDFFTSVSAGPVFGKLLANHVAGWWRKSGSPAAWRIIEIGGHDGTLAGDILSELRESFEEAFHGLEYVILEPLERLASAQKERLGGFSDRVTIVPSPQGLPERPGYLIANEVLDALPFHIVESTAAGWHEIGVGLDPDGGFVWADLGSAGDLAAGLPDRPPGYRSEVRSGLTDFLRPLAGAVAPGRMLWIDYGFGRDDYYAPARTTGTLRTFHRHRAGEDPLADPGERDITAHVDFTAVSDAIGSLGGTTLLLEDQARFLTGVARPWLLGLEGRTDAATMKLLRNFQTLTHPAQMGGRFHMLEAAFP